MYKKPSTFSSSRRVARPSSDPGLSPDSNFLVKYGYFATFKNLLFIVFAIPFVLLIRIVRPLIHVRVGSVRNDVVGHFIFDTEYYLSLKEISKIKTLDLFYFLAKTMPNKYWPIMVKRSMIIHPFVYHLERVNRRIPGWKKHCVILNEFTSRDVRGILRKTNPHISFTPFEMKRGQAFLKEVGMQKDDKFICVISRDSVYKETFGDNRDWDYHSYRDSKIVNYQKTMNKLANKGYFIFRMGKGVSGKIDDSNPKILDYANSKYRSDFLDIFLFANSTFSVGSEAGIITTTFAYRVPYCSVNIAAIEWLQAWHENNLIILKKYWLKEEKRFMTFKEIYATGAGRFLRTEQYEQLGIELIENTPEEIMDVSMEMHKRLNGTWETNDEDETLQRLFWELFPKSDLHGEIYARIGTDFLRQNRALLN
jgi:putative glycosyltransferase (TIGR04372 family)